MNHHSSYHERSSQVLSTLSLGSLLESSISAPVSHYSLEGTENDFQRSRSESEQLQQEEQERQFHSRNDNNNSSIHQGDQEPSAQLAEEDGERENPSTDGSNVASEEAEIVFKYPDIGTKILGRIYRQKMTSDRRDHHLQSHLLSPSVRTPSHFSWIPKDTIYYDFYQESTQTLLLSSIRLKRGKYLVHTGRTNHHSYRDWLLRNFQEEESRPLLSIPNSSSHNQISSFLSNNSSPLLISPSLDSSILLTPSAIESTMISPHLAISNTHNDNSNILQSISSNSPTELCSDSHNNSHQPFQISCAPPPNNNISVGALIKSNFLGTVFHIYNIQNWAQLDGNKNEKDKAHLKELAVVIYEPNILGLKGPRKMIVLIRKENQFDTEDQNQIESLYDLYKNNCLDSLIILRNKEPQWNSETESFVLNFQGRVALASVKNFQLIHPSEIDYIVMQFGRTGRHIFSLDYQYPLSGLLSFCVALTSFDDKLACE